MTGGDDGSSSSDASVDTSTKPTVEVPDGPPPTTLQVDDIVVGDGAEATAGDTLTMQYVGVNYADGKQFDASWDNGQPFTFQLGGGQVIPGWDQGIEGMKVGGRRELIVPPDLGYGEQGSPPAIKPNETLVFVVDLLDVQAGQ
ncbi:MAG: FKBP-type peptidyl-prolyl cis-trans isomerase [Vicinamibacteria bacterium]